MKIFILSLLLILNTAVAHGSRLFTSASSHTLETNSAVVTAAPFTFHALFNTTTVSNDRHILSVGSGGSTHFWSLRSSGSTGGDPLSFIARTDTSSTASSATGISVDTWHSGIGIEAAANDHRVYLDGGSEGAAGTTRSVTGVNVTGMGMSLQGSNTWNGMMAEAAIWNRAITAGERASLGERYSPGCFPNGLQMYLKLIDVVQDVVGGRSFTDTGTSVAAHPRVFYCF